MRLQQTYFLLLLFCVSTLHAQETAFLECHYAETFRDNLDKKDIIRQDEMVLRIGRTSSEFFSLWRKGREHVTDSLRAKGASMNDIMAAREKIAYPVSVQYYTIYKNYPEKGMFTQTDNLAMQLYMCTEKMRTPEWTIEQERSNILGYDCQKAVTTFYGRKWQVWFTTEIPVREGPWKLHGLPGLILAAEDEDKDYCFQCIEIRKANSVIRMPRKHYVKCTKEEFDCAVKEFNGDLNSFMKRQGKSIPVPQGGTRQDAIEFFKKNYNYIER